MASACDSLVWSSAAVDGVAWAASTRRCLEHGDAYPLRELIARQVAGGRLFVGGEEAASRFGGQVVTADSRLRRRCR